MSRRDLVAAKQGRDHAASVGVFAHNGLVGNTDVVMSRLFKPWVRFLVGPRQSIVVAMDWTEFDKDSQSTICLYLITRHGQPTPLVWRTVGRDTLANHRNRYEDEAIERLHSCLPEAVEVTLLADRGLGDQVRYEHLALLGFDYVIRFRQNIQVTHGGETEPAVEWLAVTGRAKMLKDTRVTGDKTPVPAVVLTHDRRTKDAWCIATRRADLGADGVTELYGRRFTIEETFRDTKDIHFGLGLAATHVHPEPSPSYDAEYLAEEAMLTERVVEALHQRRESLVRQDGEGVIPEASLTVERQLARLRRVCLRTGNRRG